MARPGHVERAGLCKFAWVYFLRLHYTAKMPWFRSSCKFRCDSARVLRFRRTPLRPSGAPLLLGCGHCHKGIELAHAQAFDAHVFVERRVRCRRAGGAARCGMRRTRAVNVLLVGKWPIGILLIFILL